MSDNTAGERDFDLDFTILRSAANALKRAADAAQEFYQTGSGALYEEARQSIATAMDLVDSAYRRRTPTKPSQD